MGKGLERYAVEEKLELLRLARESIKARLDNHPLPMETISLTERMMDKRACFVTLHDEEGNLRGCIGNLQAFESLTDSVMRNALNAAFNDPRFPPLQTLDEMETLTIEISVLSLPEPVESYQEIVLGRDGIILRDGESSAVFLPQVAPEQGWDMETTLSHLSQKAGLPSNAWQNPETRFEVFQGVVFSESAFKEPLL